LISQSRGLGDVYKRQISDAELEAAALALPSIVEALAGATVAKVITRAPKLVNIVINN
jgi:leucyl-tRNA synthetase